MAATTPISVKDAGGWYSSPTAPASPSPAVVVQAPPPAAIPAEAPPAPAPTSPSPAPAATAVQSPPAPPAADLSTSTSRWASNPASPTTPLAARGSAPARGAGRGKGAGRGDARGGRGGAARGGGAPREAAPHQPAPVNTGSVDKPAVAERTETKPTESAGGGWVVTPTPAEPAATSATADAATTEAAPAAQPDEQPTEPAQPVTPKKIFPDRNRVATGGTAKVRLPSSVGGAMRERRSSPRPVFPRPSGEAHARPARGKDGRDEAPEREAQAQARRESLPIIEVPHRLLQPLNRIISSPKSMGHFACHLRASWIGRR